MLGWKNGETEERRQAGNAVGSPETRIYEEITKIKIKLA